MISSGYVRGLRVLEERIPGRMDLPSKLKQGYGTRIISNDRPGSRDAVLSANRRIVGSEGRPGEYC